MIAVRRMRDFDPSRGSFESWLRGIAQNVLRKQYRQQKRRREIRESGAGEATTLAETAPTFDSNHDAELAERIAVVMSGLPARYQEVLRAKYDENLRVAEIALRAGMTSKAIESLLARARALFREAFGRINKER